MLPKQQDFWLNILLLHQNRDKHNNMHSKKPSESNSQNSAQLVQDKDPDVLKYLLLYHRDKPRDKQLMHQILE